MSGTTTSAPFRTARSLTPGELCVGGRVERERSGPMRACFSRNSLGLSLAAGASDVRDAYKCAFGGRPLLATQAPRKLAVVVHVLSVEL